MIVVNFQSIFRKLKTNVNTTVCIDGRTCEEAHAAFWRYYPIRLHGSLRKEILSYTRGHFLNSLLTSFKLIPRQWRGPSAGLWYSESDDTTKELISLERYKQSWWRAIWRYTLPDARFFRKWYDRDIDVKRLMTRRAFITWTNCLFGIDPARDFQLYTTEGI